LGGWDEQNGYMESFVEMASNYILSFRMVAVASSLDLTPFLVIPKYSLPHNIIFPTIVGHWVMTQITSMSNYNI